MTTLYNNMLMYDKANYLPCWELYMDLIETKNNPEEVDFYDWDAINFHPDAYHLHIYKKHLNECMYIIIAMVENIVRDITNSTDGYNIHDNNIIIENELFTCDNCGNVWDGYAQCQCIYDL